MSAIDDAGKQIRVVLEVAAFELEHFLNREELELSGEQFVSAAIRIAEMIERRLWVR